MLKVNELLDRTSKTVSSVAAISLGLAVIAVSAVVVKENLRELLCLRKIKAHVICVKSSHDDSADNSEKEVQKTTPKKGGSKKNASKPVVADVVEGESSDPAPEAK